MQFKKWVTATKAKMRTNQEPLDLSTTEKDLLGVFNLCKSPYPAPNVLPGQRREAFNRLDNLVLMVTRTQYKQLDVKVLLWSAIGSYCYFRQATNQRWRYGWRDRLLMNWLRYDLRSARLLLGVMRRLLAEHNQSQASIASITVDYINEYSLWAREALVVRVLLRTLVAGIPGAIVLNLLLDRLLLDVGLPTARRIVRVIYELFDFYDWPQLDDRAGKAITRLLKIYRKALWIEHNSSPKASETRSQLQCSAMRKGLEVAIRRICEHMLNCDLMLVVSYMVDWVFDSRNTEEIIITFGTVLEHIVIIHETHSYSETFQNDLFEHILELVGSNSLIVCRLGNRILQHLLDRHDNRREFQVPRIYFQNSHFNVNVAHCQSGDREFFKKYRKKFHYKIMCAVLQHGENRMQLLSLYSTLCLVATEVPCSYMAVVMANIGINIQGAAINVVDFRTITRYHLHAFTLSIMSLLCWLFNAPDFYKYVNKLINIRAEKAPHLNPPIQREYTLAQHHVLWEKEEMFFDVWEVRYSLWMRFRIKHAQAFLESMDATGPPTRSEIFAAAESGVEPSLVARVHHPTRRILLRPFLPPRHECLPLSAMIASSPAAAYDADPRLLEYLIEEPTTLRLLASGSGGDRGPQLPARPERGSFALRNIKGKQDKEAMPFVDKKASVSSATRHSLARIQSLISKPVSPKEESEPSAREKKAVPKRPKGDERENPPLSSGLRESWNEYKYPAKKKTKSEKQPKDKAKTKDGGDHTTGSSKGSSKTFMPGGKTDRSLPNWEDKSDPGTGISTKNSKKSTAPSLSNVIRRVFGSKVKKKSKPTEMEMTKTESTEGSPRGLEQDGSLQLQIWEESDKAHDSDVPEASAEAASKTTTEHPDEEINVRTKPPIDDDASGETKGSSSETSQKPSRRPSPKRSVSETGAKVVPTTKSLSNSTKAPSTTSAASKEPAAAQINTILSEVFRKVSPEHSSTGAPIRGAAVEDSLGAKGNVTEVVTANKIGALSKPTKRMGGRRAIPGVKRGTTRPATVRGRKRANRGSRPGKKTANKAAASKPPGSTDAPLAATTGTDIVPSSVLTVDETTAKEESYGQRSQPPSRGATVIDLPGDNKFQSEDVAALNMEDTTEPSNENPKGETTIGLTTEATTETPIAPVATHTVSATTTAFTGRSPVDEPVGTPPAVRGASAGRGATPGMKRAAARTATARGRKRANRGSRPGRKTANKATASGPPGSTDAPLVTTTGTDIISAPALTVDEITAKEELHEPFQISRTITMPGELTEEAQIQKKVPAGPCGTNKCDVKEDGAGVGICKNTTKCHPNTGKEETATGTNLKPTTTTNVTLAGSTIDSPSKALSKPINRRRRGFRKQALSGSRQISQQPSRGAAVIDLPGDNNKFPSEDVAAFKLEDTTELSNEKPAGETTPGPRKPPGETTTVTHTTPVSTLPGSATTTAFTDSSPADEPTGTPQEETGASTGLGVLSGITIDTPSKAASKPINRRRKGFRKRLLSGSRERSRQPPTGYAMGDLSGDKYKSLSEEVAEIKLEDRIQPSNEKSVGGSTIAPTTGETVTETYPLPLNALPGSASTTAFTDSSLADKAASTPQADAGRGVFAGKTLEGPSKAASKPINRRRRGFRKQALSGSRQISQQPSRGAAVIDLPGDNNKFPSEDVAAFKLEDTTELSNEKPAGETTPGPRKPPGETTTVTHTTPVSTLPGSATTTAFTDSSPADEPTGTPQEETGASTGLGVLSGITIDTPSKAASKPINRRRKGFRKRLLSGSRERSRQPPTGYAMGDLSGDKYKSLSEEVAEIKLEDRIQPSNEKSVGGSTIAPTTGETVTETYPLPLNALPGSASTTAFTDSSLADKAASTPQADAGRGVFAGKTLEGPSKAASKPINRRRKGFRKRLLSGSRERSHQPPTGYAVRDLSGDKIKSISEGVAAIKLEDTTEPSYENPKGETTTGVTAEATTETPIAPVATHTRSATTAFPGSSAANMADAPPAVRGPSPGRGATPGMKRAAARPATARGSKREKRGSVPGKMTAKKAAANRQIETTSPSINRFIKRRSSGKVAETNTRPSNVGVAKGSSQSDVPTGDASGDIEVSTPGNSINKRSPAPTPRSTRDRIKEKRTKQADGASANKIEPKSSPSFGTNIPTRKKNKRIKRPLREAPSGRPGAMSLTGTSTRSPRSPKSRTSVGKKPSTVESLSGIPKRSSSVVKKEASFRSINLSSISDDFDLSKTSRDQSIDNILHGRGVMGGPSTTKAKGHETAPKMGSTPGTKTNVTTRGASKLWKEHLLRSLNRFSTRVKSAHGAKAEATRAPQSRINKKRRARILKESVTRNTATTNADSSDSSSSESREVVSKSEIRSMIGSSVYQPVMAGRGEETIGSKDSSSDDSSIKGMTKGASTFQLEARAGSAFRARDRSINHPPNSTHDGATADSRRGSNKSSNQAFAATSGNIESKALRRKESKKAMAMIPKTKRGIRRFPGRPSPATIVPAAINQNMGLPVAPTGIRYSLTSHGDPRVPRRSGAPSGEIVDASGINLGTIAMKPQPTEKPQPSTPASTPSIEATAPLSTVNNPNQIKNHPNQAPNTTSRDVITPGGSTGVEGKADTSKEVSNDPKNVFDKWTPDETNRKTNSEIRRILTIRAKGVKIPFRKKTGGVRQQEAYKPDHIGD